MTDNEIIQALENEVKSAEYVDSYYCDGVDLTLIKSAGDLINQQQTENINLKGHLEQLKSRYDNAKSEIERLKECPKCIYEYDGNTTEYCVQGPCSNFKTVEQIKSEAYKEFADRLLNKVKIVQVSDLTWVWLISQDDINDIIEEMVGEE